MQRYAVGAQTQSCTIKELDSARTRRSIERTGHADPNNALCFSIHAREALVLCMNNIACIYINNILNIELNRVFFYVITIRIYSIAQYLN